MEKPVKNVDNHLQRKPRVDFTNEFGLVARRNGLR